MTGSAAAWPSFTPDEVSALGEGGVVVRDDVVGPSTIEAWRRTIEDWAENGRLRPAGVGHRKQRVDFVRSDWITWVERCDLTDAHDLFDGLRREITAATWVALDGFELQAATYGPGDRYVRHVDALRDDPSRRFTAILYLNPGWTRADGGMLLAWTPNGLRRIAPRAGRLVLFRSHVVSHAVATSHADRVALTAWMRGP